MLPSSTCIETNRQSSAVGGATGPPIFAEVVWKTKNFEE